MSTSELGLIELPAASGAPASGAFVPDADLIARLANEFFAALPGQPPVPSNPADPHAAPPPGAVQGAPPGTPQGDFASLPNVAALPPSSAVTPLSEKDLRGAPATLKGTRIPAPQAGLTHEAPIGVEPAFYFLDANALRLPAESVDPSSLPEGVGDVSLIPAAHMLPVESSEAPVETAFPTGGSRVPDLPNPAIAAAQSPATALPPGAFSGVLPSSFDFQPQLVPDLGFTARPFDPRAIRRDFPILSEQVHGRPLVWLDNAATTQKPNAVIERLSHFYRHENSNIHRAAHELAARATDAYEGARETVRRFLNASSTNEIVFVRGATEGINLIAQSYGRRHVGKDDEILITWLEHHANIVPWQQLCAEKGARLKVAPVDDDGQILVEEFERLLSSKTKIVAFSQVSNALGTVTPARELVEIAHRYGAKVLVDGAQSVSHQPVDVQALDCDWFVFSGHKVFGPTGIGAVYGKQALLDTTPPWQGGGNMIVDVTFQKTIYHASPARFEAGTGNIADAVGLGTALDYVMDIGLENIARYEHELLDYGTRVLTAVPGLHLVGTAPDKAGVLSFVLDGHRPEEVGTALNQEGIAVRAGHHCAQPILRRFGHEATVRASLALYNTCEDLDALATALWRLQGERGRTT